MSTTRDSVSSHFQTPRKEVKTDKLRGVWKCDETLPRELEIETKTNEETKK